MAGPKLPTTPKELEELTKKVEKLNRAHSRLTADQARSAALLIKQVDAMKDSTELYGEMIAQEERRQQMATVGLSEEHAEAENARWDARIERLKETRREAQALTLALDAEARASVARKEAERKAVEAADAADDTHAERAKKRHQKRSSELATFMAKAIHGTTEGVRTMVQQLGPELAVLSTIMPKLGPGKVVGKMKAELLEVDSNIRRVTKDTGLFSESMKDVLVGIGDITNDSTAMAAVIGKPLEDIGILSAEASTAMTAMIERASTFNLRFIEANPIVAKFTGNLVAGLAMIGVSERDSVEAIDQFNKALGQTPKAATQSTKQLVKMASSLGVSVGQAVKDFTSLMPTMAMWGNRVTDVFGDLQVQAVATGLSVSTLSDATSKWDTFEGAADAAQRFNAVLGGTHLSITELVSAEPAEKINLIRDAMSRAGISFGDASRRMKQVITSALGLRDVETAARIFGNEDDFELAEKNLDKTAMSSEELKGMIMESKTSVELLHTSLSRLGGGFSKFVDRTRGYALQGASAITAGFAAARRETGDMESAAMGMLGAFIATDALLGKASGKWSKKALAAIAARKIQQESAGGPEAWEEGAPAGAEKGIAGLVAPRLPERGERVFGTSTRHRREVRDYRDELHRLNKSGELTRNDLITALTTLIEKQTKAVHGADASEAQALNITNQIDLGKFGSYVEQHVKSNVGRTF